MASNGERVTIEYWDVIDCRLSIARQSPVATHVTFSAVFMCVGTVNVKNARVREKCECNNTPTSTNIFNNSMQILIFMRKRSVYFTPIAFSEILHFEIS